MNRNVGIGGRASSASFRRARLAGALLAALVLQPPGVWAQVSYHFTNFAGQPDTSGSADGTGSVARFDAPWGVAVDGAGNVYVADTYNNTIRRATPGAVMTTLAGSPGSSGNADGSGTNALFKNPTGVAVDSAGNLYVADSANHTIRQLIPSGAVLTLAGKAGCSGTNDGTGAAARFCYPNFVAVATNGDVYVADTGNHTIRKVTPAGVVTTLAGSPGQPGSADGTGSGARFCYPEGLAMDGSSNASPPSLYVCDFGNSTIRQVRLDGVVTTLAGLAGVSGADDGLGSAARFNQPYGVAVDGADTLYVADTGNNTIRKVTPAGLVTTIGGTVAQFHFPIGIAVDPADNLYVADTYDDCISKGVPAPAPQFQAVTLTAGTLVLSWTAVAGRDYQLQYETNLAQPSWQNLGGIIAATNGLAYGADILPADPQRFYRVAVLP